MANVTETSQWVTGIYQLETTDPVEGGALGISNRQATELGDRTKWLYDRTIEALKFVPKNRGWFTGLDVGSSAGSLTVSGNITSAIASVPSGGNSSVLVTFANSMTNTNYYLEFFVESLGDYQTDGDIYCPIFQKISATQARIYLQESGNVGQSLKIHLKVISLD